MADSPFIGLRQENLKLAKQDDRGVYVPDTQFMLSYHADMRDPIGTYTTGSDGTVTIEDLQPQTVYIQEISVPEHLILDRTIHSITITAGITSHYTQTNNWKQGKIQVTKYDAKTDQVVKQARGCF